MQETNREPQAHSNSKRVAVLIPCYNEEVTIEKVVKDFQRVLPQATIYVYDNNSSDRTAVIARAAGAIVRFEPRQGKGHVVRQMFRDINADYYLMVDGDDTYPAEEAPAMLQPLFDGIADTTIGDRLSNKTYERENKRHFHSFGNDLVRWLIKLIYGYSYSDVMTGYRGFTRAFVKSMPVMSKGFQLETEMSIHAVDSRARIINVPIAYRDRPEGSCSKLSTFGDGSKLLATIVALFKDYKPMAFFSVMAAMLFILGLLVGVPVVLEFVATKYVTKVPSAILAVGFVFSALLTLSVGIVLDTVAKNHRKVWELIAIHTIEPLVETTATSKPEPHSAE